MTDGSSESPRISTVFDCAPGGGTGGIIGGSTGTSLTPYDKGPLAWAACIGATLVAVGGGVLTYVEVQTYYDALTSYYSARLQYQYATDENREERWLAMEEAEQRLNLQTAAAAGSAGVTVGSLLLVVAACSPSVVLPTP